jgi:hypothetical protein
LHVLASRPVNNDILSALAMILSRREEAPRALTPVLVDKLVEMMSGELLRLTESPNFQIRFKNALSAIAGLFRYREVEPFALLAARNPAAQSLRDNLAALDELLEGRRRRHHVPLYKEKRALIDSIREYLDGGGDPDILIQIEAHGDEQEENGNE